MIFQTKKEFADFKKSILKLQNSGVLDQEIQGSLIKLKEAIDDAEGVVYSLIKSLLELPNTIKVVSFEESEKTFVWVEVNSNYYATSKKPEYFQMFHEFNEQCPFEDVVSRIYEEGTLPLLPKNAEIHIKK